MPGLNHKIKMSSNKLLYVDLYNDQQTKKLNMQHVYQGM